MIPRIRGRAGIADEGPDEGKWFYEVTIWNFAGEVQIGEPFQFGPFDTEPEACAFGREKTRELAQFIEVQMTGEKSNRYLDMKNGGIMRPWDEQ